MPLPPPLHRVDSRKLHHLDIEVGPSLFSDVVIDVFNVSSYRLHLELIESTIASLECSGPSFFLSLISLVVEGIFFESSEKRQQQ